MAYAIVGLMQSSGVSGPGGRIEYRGHSDVTAWADSQTGHPWDTLTAYIYEDEDAAESMGDPEQTLQFSNECGEWILIESV